MSFLTYKYIGKLFYKKTQFGCILWYVTGSSFHAPRQRNSTYAQTVRRSIYKTIPPEHPHSPICRYEQRPPGTPFTDRYIESCPTLRYAYVYGPAFLCRHHNRREHYTAASRALPSSHHVSYASAIISICSSVLVALFDLI